MSLSGEARVAAHSFLEPTERWGCFDIDTSAAQFIQHAEAWESVRAIRTRALRYGVLGQLFAHVPIVLSVRGVMPLLNGFIVIWKDSARIHLKSLKQINDIG